MTALVVTVLASSLLGSLHCAGMCGGFVALHSGAPGARSRGRGALAHLAYSTGRLVAYVALGTGAGALGGALDLAGALGGVQRLAGLLAGLLIVLWGSAALLEALGLHLPRAGSPRWLGRALGGGMRLVAGWPPSARAFVTGLLAAVLPCGGLWAFVVTAAGTGSAAGGALVMAVFWAGTLPMLAGVGLLPRPSPVAAPSPPGGRRRGLMIVVGLLAVAGRGRFVGPAALAARRLHAVGPWRSCSPLRWDSAPGAGASGAGGAPCAHCGLAVPRGMHDEGAARQLLRRLPRRVRRTP